MKIIITLISILFTFNCYADVVFQGIEAQGLEVNKRADVTFMQGTDYHYDVDNNTGYSNTSTQYLQSFVDTANATDYVDFIIMTGDWIRNELPLATAVENLGDVEAIYSEYTGSKYVCLGNHDADEDGLTYMTRAQYLAASTISTEFSFSFDLNGFHFVVIDSTLGGFSVGDGGWTLPQSVIDWLIADLAASDLPTVLFTHMRIDLIGAWSDSAYLINSANIQTILENDGDVFAVFQGHNHVNDYNEINNIDYVTLINSIDGNNSILVDIFDDERIRITGYGTATGRFLK